MNRKKTLLLTLLATTSLTCGLASCQGPVESSSQTNTGIVGEDDEYVVKFNNNFDGTVIKVTVEAGKTVTLPEEPTRPGYIFSGWFLDYREDTTERFDETQPINSDITVFAKWTQNITQHIVTLHYQDRVTPDRTVIVDHGEPMEAPTEPEYPDGTMAFTGWYTDAQCTKQFDFNSAVTSDLDLYAGWRVSKATITFNLNYTGAAGASKVVVEIGEPMTAPDEPVREHYAFLGWFDRAVGGTAFDFASNIEGDMTLYAHWEENEFLVSFDANGGTFEAGTATSSYIDKGTSAVSFAEGLESKLTYVGHDFKGWYLEKLEANSDDDATKGVTPADLSSIDHALTVYAGWALSTYTVSFDLNYQDAPDGPASQSVKYGKMATQPTDPTRDDYIFGGWYLDAQATEQFTFDMQVTESITLYAKWIEAEAPQEPVTVSYYIGSVLYTEKTVDFNSPASSNAPADPTKDNALFAGWYRDAALTTKFNMSANLSEDISVYARFLDRFTFEAEATNFSGKVGMGTSTNSFEEGMIFDYHWIRDGSKQTVSNGFFVRELYYNGASLEFEIESTKAVTDAVMYLRVSSEHDRFVSHPVVNNVEYNYLSAEEFKIVVNGDYDGDTPLTWLDYAGLYMPMANLVDVEDLSGDKTPFEDCFISSAISLQEGYNYIQLYVDNYNAHGGTFQAEAPMIDCMYIYTDASLSMTDYEYYTRPNVNVQND